MGLAPHTHMHSSPEPAKEGAAGARAGGPVWGPEG